MAFKKDNKIKSNFSRISIGLASPEEILERSSGEVLKPETVNYRTYKPERDGLFCERIFGPTKDYECHCGKYKRIRYRGIVCDRCGVEVTEKKVRRERMGHITLTVPVAHIWYFRSTPNKIGSLLGIPSKKLESVIYYERYIVIQAGAAKDLNIDKLALLSEDEYLDVLDRLPKDNQSLDDSDPQKFIAGMGAEAIYTLLSALDLDELSYELRHKTESETSQQRKAEALKRLSVIEAFRESKDVNRPEWMIMKVIPVIPPDLRPLVPLDGGRFATSDLNDLYRRVIIRNNRLKKLIEIKAPEVILRNEKRMLQEAVDSLFDNSRKSNAVKTDANRTLKSLSDSLKGKQGRFRQNLLGKRVDYSARSVIVVGPELHMHECGLPKFMAAELYKPFIIRKLIERGIVKTVRSAKKIVDKKEPVIWDILENVMKGHPVLLNRAPTLHRLGIQAFQPKLIEGKAIQLHPLACTAFNADFDGDQMAVHLPLGNAAILEAQLLMLGSHNILNPANGAPITVPSQDMVLGLYYITKPREGSRGQGMTFYGPEEVIIAYNEGRVDLHAKISIRLPKDMTDPSKGYRIFENTTVGRVIFNQVVPPEVGYINELLTKKSLRDIIGTVVKVCGVARTAQFLDDIKSIGYTMAFKGGLSFNLADVIIPQEKAELVESGYNQVEEIQSSFNMGLITNNERYNQIIDIWTTTNSRLTNMVTKTIEADQQGFNPIFMMLDSGARGSKEQIRQLCGMRGLMAKPQKSGSTGAEIIENPILSNFKEGLSVLEYFISTHGARKGLADTALKTADAGYLTRRLVDVSHDVIINEEDCKTLRGIVATAIKNKDEIVESLYDRILGRTSVHDIYNPLTGELILPANEEITEDIAAKISALPIEQVEIRSVLTCESRKGVCAKCYGRNLATGRMVEKGEVVGVIAAQSIGEPGTQLTLRTFHVGGTASSIASESEIVARYDGRLEFEELRTVTKHEDDGDFEIVIGRTAEMRIVDINTGITLSQHNIPYGAKLFQKDGANISKGDRICEWDAYNAVTITELAGTVAFDSLIEGVTFREEATDEYSLHKEKVIIESRDKSKNPTIHIMQNGNEVKQYNLPVGAHLMVEDGQEVQAGDVIVKIPRAIGKSGDITGGLPRVTELFEARNPSNPAIVSEINGEVQMGKIKRGNREIIIRSKSGDEKRYLVPLSKQILVQENDYIRAGMPLSDGAVSPADILAIQGPIKVQEYIVNEIQEVYRMQGVKINDKHFEIIVRQMMRKVEIVDPGDTRFLPEQLVDKWEFNEENDSMFGKKVVQDAGDSKELRPGQIVTARRLRDENSMLKRQDLKLVEARDAIPATSNQILQGITRAALRTNSFMSAASFQETTKVLSEAAIRGKVDTLEGLKENVICGHLIPAGTGQREYERIIVASMEDYNRMAAAPRRSAKEE
ncbi:MAG TPA: DNA-directed RNA polymerase subunit beta' [Candidatus Coprenecus stercorigallinarum]|nr:DNA-directed RNA polymerase subunit beta' [Candidatus Coprenecus stercorigallinarum]